MSPEPEHQIIDRAAAGVVAAVVAMLDGEARHRAVDQDDIAARRQALPRGELDGRPREERVVVDHRQRAVDVERDVLADDAAALSARPHLAADYAQRGDEIVE